MGRLDGKAALVTGAGNGIGKEIALLLAGHGASVVACDLGTDMLGGGSDPSFAEQTAAEIVAAGGRAVASHADVSTFDGGAAAVAAVVEAFGQVDITACCAGAAIEGSIFEMPLDLYEKTIALQMSQKWFVARHAVPQMAAQGWGRVINTTSHGATGALGQPAFAAAMGGVIGMTRAMATETAGTGVTVNCLAPGAATRLWAKSHDDFKAWHAQGLIDDEMWASYINTPPARYVAPIVAWLCTDAAAGVTGHVFHATGGTVGIWNQLRDERGIHRGDHTQVEPWTLDELDQLVPKYLLGG